jgi:hypothetical protein
MKIFKNKKRIKELVQKEYACMSDILEHEKEIKVLKDELLSIRKDLLNELEVLND